MISFIRDYIIHYAHALYACFCRGSVHAVTSKLQLDYPSSSSRFLGDLDLALSGVSNSLPGPLSRSLVDTAVVVLAV